MSETETETKPNVVREHIMVPVGHVVGDKEVTQAYPVLIIAGVRWHAEWPEPRISVQAFRFFPMGDALVMNGRDVRDAYNVLLPEAATALAHLHGNTLSELEMLGGDDPLKALGLTAPDKPEPLSAFIERR